jgi:hypothetical protein
MGCSPQGREFLFSTQENPRQQMKVVSGVLPGPYCARKAILLEPRGVRKQILIGMIHEAND